MSATYSLLTLHILELLIFSVIPYRVALYSPFASLAIRSISPDQPGAQFRAILPCRALVHISLGLAVTWFRSRFQGLNNTRCHPRTRADTLPSIAATDPIYVSGDTSQIKPDRLIVRPKYFFFGAVTFLLRSPGARAALSVSAAIHKGPLLLISTASASIAPVLFLCLEP